MKFSVDRAVIRDLSRDAELHGVTLIIFGSVTEEQVMADEMSAIRAVIGERTAAIRTRDAQRVIATTSVDVTVFDLAPPLRLTGDQARDAKGLEEWFRTWEGPIEVETDLSEIIVSGDIAFAYGLSHMQGTKVGGESRADLWFRSTIGLRKIEGNWKIIHEHASVPFYMDGSYRAAIDLKP